MPQNTHPETLWARLGMTRRAFLRYFGIASTTVTFSPFFIRRLSTALAQSPATTVYLVRNGDYAQNITKLLDLLGGAGAVIGPTDVVVIKGNAQWPRQGYTHTGCMKAVIDNILKIPGFEGEIYICDNVQVGGAVGRYGFDVSPGDRLHNWPDHNWNSLAAEYRTQGKPVATKRWYNSTGDDPTTPAAGEGWVRSYFSHQGRPTFLSYPVFESPLTAGRMIDPKNGVWESGKYTGRKVKTIVMPTLNNHGFGGEDYAGITSAIKSFYGMTEIHDGEGGMFRGNDNIHRASFYVGRAESCGELVARYIRTILSPNLYITPAIWSGHESRTGNAVETKTVLACNNPATLDYVACRDVISPHASFLNPDSTNNTRRQIMGCINGGVGTIDPSAFDVVSYDFLNPKVNRLDVDREIKKHGRGEATEKQVKEMLRRYLEE